jgi:MHS family proline/betaine transporter-like MFS transporter
MTAESLPASQPSDDSNKPLPAANDIAAETRMRRRVVFASILGNGLEWFDFVSYGYFASIIAKVFFPAGSDLSLMLTYATFAVGFVVRPIGGILFGVMGDRFGRKPVLVATLLMIGIGTTAIGFLPTYAEIGFWAPLALVILRVV